MFVGASGIGRVVARAIELMQQHDTADVRPYGGIDIATLQRYLNFHYSVSLDLFGAETSTNAANYFAGGLKGRFQEAQRDDDHQLRDQVRTIAAVADGRVVDEEVGALAALNATLRDDYVDDCQKGVDRWNRALAAVDAQLTLPHVGFNRAVGRFGGQHVTPDGKLVDGATWASGQEQWLPTAGDREYVASLMKAVREPGRMAGWIAPPSSGIHAKPVDFEYVRI